MDLIASTALTVFLASFAKKGAAAPAETFKNVWKFIFGPVDDFLIRSNAKREIEREKYIEAIKNNADSILPENLQNPDIELLAPALEASKYFLNEDAHRDMFAKLVASSFDKSKKLLIHHSFANIITQLNPLDAKILRYLPAEFYLLSCHIICTNGNESICRDLLVNDAFSDELMQTNVSTNNLERLNLIGVMHNATLLKVNGEHKPTIDLFKATKHYSDLHKVFPGAKFDIFTEPSYLTPLGHSFRQICL